MNISGMLYLNEIAKMGLKYIHRMQILSNELWLSCKKYEELLRGVIVRPLENYKHPNCLRITVGTQDENERFISGLKKDRVLDENSYLRSWPYWWFISSWYQKIL